MRVGASNVMGDMILQARKANAPAGPLRRFSDVTRIGPPARTQFTPEALISNKSTETDSSSWSPPSSKIRGANEATHRITGRQ